MRAVEKKEPRGSLKWIRQAVNDCPDLLNRKVRTACGLDPSRSIVWVSPLAKDDYAEYGDAAFLDHLGVSLPKYPLKRFWPNGGPRWDALARTDDGQVLLVEAKANIPEVVSSGTGASEMSKALIEQSLRDTQAFLSVDPAIPWSGKLYQYANRVAHLYLVRELNSIPAHLLFVYFTGDRDVGGPDSVAEWKAALTVAKGVLGLGERHRLSKYIAEIFIDVEELHNAA